MSCMYVMHVMYVMCVMYVMYVHTRIVFQTTTATTTTTNPNQCQPHKRKKRIVQMVVVNTEYGMQMQTRICNKACASSHRSTTNHKRTKPLTHSLTHSLTRTTPMRPNARNTNAKPKRKHSQSENTKRDANAYFARKCNWGDSWCVIGCLVGVTLKVPEQLIPHKETQFCCTQAFLPLRPSAIHSVSPSVCQ